MDTRDTILPLPINAECLDCRYTLTGLPERTCPECGRAFDARNPSTYRLGARRSWRDWASPPTMSECGTLLVLTTLGLLQMSVPLWLSAVPGCCFYLLMAPVWLGLVVLTFVRAALCYLDRERAGRDAHARGRVGRWLVAPLCAAVMLTGITYPWPARLRFAMSRPAFERAAQEALQRGKLPGRWIGLYQVSHIVRRTYRDGRTHVLFVTGTSIGDPVGIEFDPSPRRLPGRSDEIQLAPGWYTYED